VRKIAEYTVHNYHPYNVAVDNELAHHAAIAAAVREESRLRRAKIWLFAAGAFAIISLAVSLIVWLFTSPAMSLPIFAKTSESASELGALARGDVSKELSVSTRFNVFDKSPMATGEIVITSKEYAPEDLNTPEYQYCYVTNSTEIANAQQTLLAEVQNGRVDVKTNETYLLENALPLCTFKTNY